MTVSVVCLSGGMDSATVLAEALNRTGNAKCLGFNYGSKHNPYENKAARDLAAYYQVSYEEIDLTSVMKGFKSNLLKSGGEIPEGHYEADTMTQTVVPGRNIIFASIVAGYAWSNLEPGEEGLVWLGIHAGDHAIYPDCRPEFYDSMRHAIHFGTGGRVDLAAPFLHQTKIGILERGFALKVPYARTRTCYKDQETACGKCGSCQERLAAFAYLDVNDPIPYETRQLLPK